MRARRWRSCQRKYSQNTKKLRICQILHTDTCSWRLNSDCKIRFTSVVTHRFWNNAGVDVSSVCLVCWSWIDTLQDPLPQMEAIRGVGGKRKVKELTPYNLPPLSQTHTHMHLSFLSAHHYTAHSTVSHRVISAGRGRVVHSEVAAHVGWFLACVFELSVGMYMPRYTFHCICLVFILSLTCKKVCINTWSPRFKFKVCSTLIWLLKKEQHWAEVEAMLQWSGQ